MMKVRKILLSGCLVATLCSCGGSQNENLNLTLSKDALFDKVKGAWAGQVIGCTYGGPTEFRYLSTMIPDSIVMPWGPGEIKKWYDGGGGLYDDVYVDLTFVETFERYGLDAPADSFATAFLAKEYPLCHANQMARYNLLHGLTPPASGHWKNNPHANCLDFQIEADFAGIMAPGMVNSATEICDRVGHIMAYGDGWYGGVYVAAMYSLAYVSDDVEYVVTEALRSIPRESRFHACMADVINWHKQYPEDWKKCWEEIEKKWGSNDIACPDGVEMPFNIETYVNGAYIILGLLYGQGDFEKTIDISTRAGQDSDCNPSSAGGILGTMIGYDAIPEYWMKGLRGAEGKNFKYTLLCLDQIYTISNKHALEMIRRNGGKVEKENVTIAVQRPETVRLEQSFTDMYPTAKVELSKHDIDILTFEFEGTGFVLRGEAIRRDMNRPDAVLKVNLYLDGELVEKAAAFPTYFHDRRLDIFWKYQLPEGKHQVKVEVIKDGANALLKSWDYIVYSKGKK